MEPRDTVSSQWRPRESGVLVTRYEYKTVGIHIHEHYVNVDTMHVLFLENIAQNT